MHACAWRRLVPRFTPWPRLPAMVPPPYPTVHAHPLPGVARFTRPTSDGPLPRPTVHAPDLESSRSPQRFTPWPRLPAMVPPPYPTVHTLASAPCDGPVPRPTVHTRPLPGVARFTRLTSDGRASLSHGSRLGLGSPRWSCSSVPRFTPVPCLGFRGSCA